MGIWFRMEQQVDELEELAWYLLLQISSCKACYGNVFSVLTYVRMIVCLDGVSSPVSETTAVKFSRYNVHHSAFRVYIIFYLISKY